MRLAPIKSQKPDKNDKISVFIGINGTRVILLYPLFAILFIIFFDSIGEQYSSLLKSILDQIGVITDITERKLSEDIFFLKEYTEYIINIQGSQKINFPILMFQKIQFVIIMFSISLGLHLNSYKKLKYLSVAAGYWTFVIIQDILVAVILYNLDVNVDALFLGSLMLLTSSYFGSVLLMYAIFKTADLPKPVKIIPKIKRNHLQYYCILIFAVIITISLFYFLVAPFLELIEYNIAVAVMVFSIFNLFKFIVYGVGYIFTYIDKPIRNYSYTPLVSVMIPARNEEKSIVENIKAVNAAAGKYLGNVELIIIDDKSTDNTRKVVEETFHNCKNLTGRLITGPGKGKSAAMNFGLEHANGEVVLNLDSDTVITEDAIKELVPYFTDPLVGGVGCHVEQKNEVGLLRKMFAIELIYLFGLVKPGQQGLDSIMVVIGGSSMYRTKVLREIGGWGPIKSGDDGDMTLRVGRYGYKIIQYKEKTLARSEIFSDITEWFIQRTRWYIAFFYTHARNFTAVKERQGGLRATYQMPFVYVGSFTRFTTLLFTEMTILMGIASYLQSGFKNIEVGGILALVINPMMITLLLLGLYYKKIKKLPYFFLWPIYSYLSALCSFRALMVVMGDEGWESKAAVE